MFVQVVMSGKVYVLCRIYFGYFEGDTRSWDTTYGVSIDMESMCVMTVVSISFASVYVKHRKTVLIKEVSPGM